MRKKPLIIGLSAVYLAAVAGYCICLADRYRRSFEPVAPYSHTMRETVPATTELQETASTVKLTEVSTVLPETVETVTEVTEIPTETAENPTETVINFPVDLNTATCGELCAIPEVGDTLANAILAYRAQIGQFVSREQLKDVPGIGEKRLAQLMPYLYIENEQPMPTDPPAEEIPHSETPPVENPPETEPPTIPIIDLNTATREELLLLPGCTEEIADAILQLRDDLEGFRNPLELRVNDTIPKSLYDSWEEYLIVAEPATNFITSEPLPAE